MFSVLFNTCIYLIIIALGYTLKKLRVLPEAAADVTASLVINITLPAMLLYSSDGIEMSGSIALYMLIGILANVFLLALGMLVFRKEQPLRKAVMLLSGAGTDVGNFVLPFIVTFFPGEGVIALSAFNIGNTIMIQGFNYVFASAVSSTGRRFGVKDALIRLVSSVTFDTYLLILFLACTRLRLPEAVMDIVKVPADANIFIVMMMIGLKLELRSDRSEQAGVLRVLLHRLAGGAVLAGLVWLLPIGTVPKIVITAAFFGPPSSVSSVFSKRLGYPGSLPATATVVCIFTGMAIITAEMMLAVAG